MLKGSHTIAFALTLTSLFLVINTNIAYAKQNPERGTYVINEPEPGDAPGLPRPPRPCSRPGGTFPCTRRPAPPIPIIDLELNDVTNDVAIKKLEALKASGKATNDDYILLGYFYSLEKKYDLSEANYLKALELATDDGRKAIIQQELKKVRDHNVKQ
ncbi:hypothetical protein [Brasilonema bromeliae]|uniref:Tetratricopeptide repeat protein n=1 Tax=Brasilonema bromeliae SPC951 TaxID=385972 RepID=A0ABX1P5S7_9CYAN|nr:hypothetical protein [Brasilonema bromeliae]NMG19207.1 hypothetical protein [Brasilonema bromeliae SPC951]